MWRQAGRDYSGRRLIKKYRLIVAGNWRQSNLMGLSYRQNRQEVEKNTKNKG
jgi:hypothetical protein